MKRISALLMAVVMCFVVFGCGPKLDPETHDHTEWSEWVTTKEATCTEAGEKKRTCADCGKEEIQTIPAAGHKYGKWTTVKEATCDEDGSRERICTVDQEKQTEVIPKTGNHTFVGTVTTPGDCVTDEITTYSCSVCENHAHDYTQTGDKKPDVHHNPDAVLDCGLHCSACGTGLDHTAADCGIAGHFSCDGANHDECKITKPANMEFEAINDGAAWKFVRFTGPSDATELWMPAYIDGKPVVEIEAPAFDATSGNEAIDNWLISLTYLYIPDTVKTISGRYFLFHTSGLTDMKLPKTIESWGSDQFVSCLSLKTLTIPRGTSVLVDLVGNIRESSDYKLESFTIPSSFTDLGTTGHLAHKAKFLTSINYEGTEAEWKALLDDSTFENDDIKKTFQDLTNEGKVVYGYDYNTLYEAQDAKLADHIVYQSESAIGTAGFKFGVKDGEAYIDAYEGEPVETLEIPLWAVVDGNKYKVTSIGQSAFDQSDGRYDTAEEKAHVANVKTIRFHEKSYIKRIGDYAFWGMPSLETMTIPSGVQYVGYMAFNDCSKMTELTIEEGVDVKLGQQFRGMTALKKLYLPSSITYPFDGDSFKTSYSNAAGPDFTALAVTFGGSGDQWNNLTAQASSDVKAISPEWFGGLTIETDEATGYQYLPTQGGTAYRFARVSKTDNPVIEIPATYKGKPVTEIARGAFNPSLNKDEVKDYLTNTVKEIWLRSSGEGHADHNITWIGGNNFVGMKALERICLPIRMEEGSIGRGCFQNTLKLANLRIPEGIETLEDAFTWDSGTMWGGELASVKVVEGKIVGVKLGLPSTFKAFTGTTWKDGGTTFVILFNIPAAEAPAKFTAILDASPGIKPDGHRQFFDGFGAAALLYGSDSLAYLTYNNLIAEGY